MSYCAILSGITQSPTYIYIPNLEVWGPDGTKKLLLHSGLPSTGLKQIRIVDVSASGTHTVKLNPGEDGSIAVLKSNGFYISPFIFRADVMGEIALAATGSTEYCAIRWIDYVEVG